MENPSFLRDYKKSTLIVAILIRRLGGHVVITQDDIDAVAFNKIDEEGFPDGHLEYTLVERKRAS